MQVGNSNRKSLPTCGKPYPNPSPLKLKKKKKNKPQPTFLLSSHLRCALERLSPETSFLYIRTVYIFLECVCHHRSQEPTKLCELYVRMLLLFRVRLTIASTHTHKYPMYRKACVYFLKGMNPEYSLEEPMLKLKLQYFHHLMGRTDSWERP